MAQDRAIQTRYGKAIFYATRPYWAAESLCKVIESIVPKDDIEICRSIEELSGKICPHSKPSGVAVILTGTRVELARLMSIRKTLTEANIILIIPDSEKETVVLGHSFYPRFLSYADGDFRDVAAVLSKMLAHSHEAAAGMMGHMWEGRGMEEARGPSVEAYQC